MQCVLEIAGTLLVLLGLSDIFLTVLYVRSSTALLGDHLAHGGWRTFRWVANLFPSHRGRILSFGGAVVLLVMIFVWVFLLTCGFALIALPNLGKSLAPTDADTPRNFVTAMYFSGANFATVGTGDLRPISGGMRVLLIIMPLVGMSVITLTLAYLLQVYNALLRRNTTALRLHFATGATGDAAEFVAGLGAGGDFGGARSDLAQIAEELVNLYESHHFYSTLIYFRFHDPHYSLARVATIVMDGVTLIRSALDRQRYMSLQECAAVTTLWEGGTHLLREMARVLLPSECGTPDGAVDQRTQERWRKHYRLAAARFREVGIATAADESAGEDRYIEMRQKWEGSVRGFGRYMDFEIPETDPAVSHSA